jgi:hypothetical protein
MAAAGKLTGIVNTDGVPSVCTVVDTNSYNCIQLLPRYQQDIVFSASDSSLYHRSPGEMKFRLAVREILRLPCWGTHCGRGTRRSRGFYDS